MARWDERHQEKSGRGSILWKDRPKWVCLFVLLFGDHSQKEKTGYKEDLYHDGRDLSAYLCSI